MQAYSPQRTFGECTDIISDKLGNFLNLRNGSDDYTKIYNIDSRPLQNIVVQIIGFYEEKLDPFVTAELLTLAEDTDPSIYLDSPADEFSGGIDKEFMPHAIGYYTANALIQFNNLLPELKTRGIARVGTEKVLKLQQAVDYANNACAYISLLKKFADYQPPEKIKQQASSGGKARAEKLYGRTKEFVARRFTEIHSRNSTMSLSQIAVKISTELEENPIPGDEPLTNAYDTIYRWVRVLNKTKTYQS